MRRRVQEDEPFGKLIAREKAGLNAQNRQMWRCDCQCGGELVTRADYLISGKAKSCGCDHDKNLLHQTFGRLRVIGRVEESPQKRRRWLCVCKCGNHKEANTNSLTTGETRSCGCLVVGNLKHGYRIGKEQSDRQRDPTYRTWVHMKSRCQNPNNPRYKDYGGRGITVCERWQDFENFLADMGPRPEGKSLDRWPDNDDIYRPGNCRWATPEEQARNRSDTVLVEHDGKCQTIMEWEDEYGMERNLLRSRLHRGMSMEDALRQDKMSFGGKKRQNFEIVQQRGITSSKKPTTVDSGRKRAYSAWSNMKSRCDNPNIPNYADYGGRGITYCDRWKSFENFLEDMGVPPPGHSLDRWPDNNDIYRPGNCRWATLVEQRLNQRPAAHPLEVRRIFIEWSGERKSLRQWAITLGITDTGMLARYNNPNMDLATMMTPGKISRKKLVGSES